jgi:aminoglycoside phosphotransferase family enzyme/predicted kinase
MEHEAQTVGEVTDDQRRLIEALRDPACYPHAAPRVRVIETHISYVILTGTFAYKIKKRVDLGFLDFTTLEKRKLFCDEELRLNSRLAPDIYLEVVPICETSGVPRIGKGCKVVEYAVRMREFAQEALADRAIVRGELTAAHTDALAHQVAAFHSSLPSCAEDDEFGGPEAIWANIAQNFHQLRALPVAAAPRQLLDEVEAWSALEHGRLRECFLKRKHEGKVRECHGDLHLGNIVLLKGSPRIFDCIEFNAELRWIDVMNDIAFLVMDVRAGGRQDFAARFLNAYLELSGDYGGLRVLRYYLVYRAMVRAKVSLMRAQQLAGKGASSSLRERFRSYLALARSLIHETHRFVLITHGFSGSGKTTLSLPLIELSGAIRIRSDVERKRLHPDAPAGRQQAAVASGLYSDQVTEQTYRRLLELARVVFESGHGVIVDATFLKTGQRDMFRAFAAQAGAPFAIVDFSVGVETLRSRIGVRLRQGQDASDADLAVLDYQLSTQEPLQQPERAFVFTYDASRPQADAQRLQSWTPLLQRLLPPAE